MEALVHQFDSQLTATHQSMFNCAYLPLVSMVMLGMAYAMVACPFRTLVVLYRMFTFIMCLIWLMFGILFLHLSTSLGCFCPRTFKKKDWIAHTHTGESKRPIAERTPNFNEMKLPICHFLPKWSTRKVGVHVWSSVTNICLRIDTTTPTDIWDSYMWKDNQI